MSLYCLEVEGMDSFVFSSHNGHRLIGIHSWDNASACSACEMPQILVFIEQESDWLTVIPITQPLRPIVQAKAHKSRIITCCMLLPVCPTTSPCKMHCTWSKYISFLMHSQGWGLKFSSTTLKAMWNRTTEELEQRMGRAAGTWGHGSPYRAIGAEQTVQTGEPESLCSFTLLSSRRNVWWAQTASST